MGDVHTQAIEGFWSSVKRGIGGVWTNTLSAITDATWAISSSALSFRGFRKGHGKAAKAGLRFGC